MSKDKQSWHSQCNRDYFESLEIRGHDNELLPKHLNEVACMIAGMAIMTRFNDPHFAMQTIDGLHLEMEETKDAVQALLQLSTNGWKIIPPRRDVGKMVFNKASKLLKQENIEDL